MYALDEKPLWPAPGKNKSIYRLTYLSAFEKQIAVKLIVASDGNGEIEIRSIDKDGDTGMNKQKSSVSGEKMLRFTSALEQAHFWQTTTELAAPPGYLREDGAEWIMEGVKDGNYHIAVRWCPDIERQNADEVHFADAGRLLFELAGLNHPGGLPASGRR